MLLSLLAFQPRLPTIAISASSSNMKFLVYPNSSTSGFPPILVWLLADQPLTPAASLSLAMRSSRYLLGAVEAIVASPMS